LLRVSGVVFAAIPGRRECHVIARLRGDPPDVVIVVGSIDDEPECRSESLDREGFDLDAVERDLAEFLEPVLVNLPRSCRGSVGLDDSRVVAGESARPF
jgi:hypothetical protein